MHEVTETTGKSGGGQFGVTRFTKGVAAARNFRTHPPSRIYEISSENREKGSSLLLFKELRIKRRGGKEEKGDQKNL